MGCGHSMGTREGQLWWWIADQSERKWAFTVASATQVNPCAAIPILHNVLHALSTRGAPPCWALLAC